MIGVAHGATSTCSGFICVGVHGFDPSLGVGWQEILSWYSMEWAMEMVVDLSVAQHELPGTRDTGIPNWHWNLGGTIYHSPHMSVDYDLDGTIDLAVEHAHLLREFRSAAVAN